MTLSTGQKLLIGGGIAAAGIGYLLFRGAKNASASVKTEIDSLKKEATVSKDSKTGSVILDELPKDAFPISMTIRNLDGTGKQLWWTPGTEGVVLEGEKEGHYTLAKDPETAGLEGFAIVLFHRTEVGPSITNQSMKLYPLPARVKSVDPATKMLTVVTTQSLDADPHDEDVAEVALPAGLEFQVPFALFATSVNPSFLGATYRLAGTPKAQ